MLRREVKPLKEMWELVALGENKLQKSKKVIGQNKAAG